MGHPVVKVAIRILVRGNCKFLYMRNLNDPVHLHEDLVFLLPSPSLTPRSLLLAPQHGFTLIELLVVLVVMGVALGMVVVQLLPDNRAILREEAQRLALLLENAGMEARASGRSLAWSSETTGYSFWKKNDYADWVRIEEDAAFRMRSLPQGMHIVDVRVEEQPLKEGEYLALSANSFALPFLIRMESQHAYASVIGSSTGKVSARVDGETDGLPLPTPLP